MKIEKITDAFVNEFDGQAQSCADNCTDLGSLCAYIGGQL